MERIAGLSPRATARLTGVFEALEGLPAAFGQVIVLGMLVVNGNAAATAHSINSRRWLGQAGAAGVVPLTFVQTTV